MAGDISCYLHLKLLGFVIIQLILMVRKCEIVDSVTQILLRKFYLFYSGNSYMSCRYDFFMFRRQNVFTTNIGIGKLDSEAATLASGACESNCRGFEASSCCVYVITMTCWLIHTLLQEPEDV